VPPQSAQSDTPKTTQPMAMVTALIVSKYHANSFVPLELY